MANANPGNVIRRKLVIIGDGACGKTSLLSVFTLGYFPTHYVSPVLHTDRRPTQSSEQPPRATPAPSSGSSDNCRVDGKSVQLALWDTAGQEDYERLRPLAYSKAHVILIGFSVDSPDSLDNVKHKVRYVPMVEPCLQTSNQASSLWIEEATERCPDVPIILVGLKKDLRDDPVAIEEMRKKSLKFVAERQGEAVAQEVGARKYLECSSLSGEGVDDVFEAATRAALLTFEKGEGGGCCVIL
ncbi:GTP-binding protein rho2 [Apiospora rasikravindrae]|uniref:GTP-binding protein rho2 n=1 Tax=Apiospora rasikravindrae TaxID=990691 RepID=A0ABR1TCW3_9PEZI